MSTIKIELTPEQAVHLVSMTTLADIYDKTMEASAENFRNQIREQSTSDEEFFQEYSVQVSKFKK